jgi:hypothetical protein
MKKVTRNCADENSRDAFSTEAKPCMQQRIFARLPGSHPERITIIQPSVGA